MAILVNCTGCAKQFRAKDQFRNTRLKCPSCKAEVLVNGPHVCGSDVFISHSAADKQVADAVCGAMESKSLRCWIAPRDIPAGTSWGSAIIEGIEDSRVMLLVFSEKANQSDQVLREVERAVAKRVPIVPVRIDDAPPRKDFEYFLASCHWLDVRDGGLESHLARLTKTIRPLLLERAEGEPGPSVWAPAAVPAAPPSAPAARRQSWRTVVALLGLLLLSVAVGVVAFVLRDAKDDANPVQSATTQPATSPAGDLLSRAKLPEDVVSGIWTRGPDGITASGPMPGRLRLGTPPPGDYDLRLEFTPLVGDQAVGVVLSRFGKSVGFATGGRIYGFITHGKGSRENLLRKLGTMPNGVRTSLLLKVRKNEIAAHVDGQYVGLLRTDYKELEVPTAWKIGRNELGIVTYRDLVVHAVECVPVDEEGEKKE